MLFLHSVIYFSRVNRLWLAWAVRAGASTTRDDGSTFHSPRWLQAALAHSVGSRHRHWVWLATYGWTLHHSSTTDNWRRGHSWKLLACRSTVTHDCELRSRWSICDKRRTLFIMIFRLVGLKRKNRRRMESLTLIACVNHLHVWIVQCARISSIGSMFMMSRLMDDNRFARHIAIWKRIIDLIILILLPCLLDRLLPAIHAIDNEHIAAEEEAAPANDGSNDNRDVSWTACIITSITITVSIAATLWRGARGAATATSTLQASQLSSKPMLLPLLLFRNIQAIIVLLGRIPFRV